MTPTLKSLVIDKLSPLERIALANALWDSVSPEDMPIPNLTDEQQRMLAERIADDDANPDDVIPWEQVKAELQSRLKP